MPLVRPSRQRVAKGWSEFRKNLEVIGVFEDFRIVSFLNQKEGSSEFSSTGRGIFLMYKNKFFPALTAQKIGLKVSTTNLTGSVGNSTIFLTNNSPAMRSHGIFWMITLIVSTVTKKLPVIKLYYSRVLPFLSLVWVCLE